MAATYAVILISALCWSWPRTWTALGVRPMSLSFGDLRAITGAPITVARGLDPMVDNVGDPWHRPANYPRIWVRTMMLFRLGPDDTVAVALALVAAYIGSLIVLNPLIACRSDALLLYLGSVTPATLLAVERGKIEFVVLLCVCVAVVTLRRPWVMAAALTAATMLKVFPIFGFSGASALNPRTRWPIAAAVVALVAIGYAERHDLSWMRQSVPIDPVGAYGVPSLAADILLKTHHVLSPSMTAAAALAISVAALIAGCWAAVRLISPGTLVEQGLVAESVNGFLISGAIYAGTFLTSANYDYRLVFLMPAVPFMNALRRSPQRVLMVAGFIGLAASGLSMSETPLTRVMGTPGVATNVIAKTILLAVVAFGSTLILRRHAPWETVH